MSEFEEVQKLIRLKRYEQPPSDYYENFLSDFQKRQRAELLNRSARSLFCERFATYCQSFGPEKWVVAAGAASVFLFVGYQAISGQSDGGSPAKVADNPESPTNTLWLEVQPAIHPKEYPHPFFDPKATQFEPVVPVRIEGPWLRDY